MKYSIDLLREFLLSTPVNAMNWIHFLYEAVGTGTFSLTLSQLVLQILLLCLGVF